MELRYGVLILASVVSAGLVATAHLRYPRQEPQVASFREVLSEWRRADPKIGQPLPKGMFSQGSYLLVFPECVSGCNASQLDASAYPLRSGEKGIIMSDHIDYRSKLGPRFSPGFTFMKFDLRLAKFLNIAWAGRWVRVRDGNIIGLQSTPEERA
ncbi:MAG: hypothetical protein SFX74_06295 [Fimbriimonadaceae bacterium]|nr:hypothetical protein [Fimbriimonadaceae bacterium]